MTTEYIGPVLVVAWIFAGCAAPQRQTQPPEPDVAVNLTANGLPSPVGCWVVDARATAHAAAAKYGFQTKMRVEGTRTNYSYTYYGKARDRYDRVLKRVSDPGMQRSLVFQAGCIGEDRLITSRSFTSAPARFEWATDGRTLELLYPHVTCRSGVQPKPNPLPDPGRRTHFCPRKVRTPISLAHTAPRADSFRQDDHHFSYEKIRTASPRSIGCHVWVRG